MNPLVSIIIPCYRQSHWLAQAVKSCLQQTYSNIEIIVVNDGSDDDTEQVAKSFSNIVYVHQQNAGQSAARNHGIKVSKGGHLLFLDADDALHPLAVEKLMTAANDGTIAMIGWKPFVNDVSEPGPDVFPPLENPVPSLLRNNPGPPHMFLSPREFILKINGWDLSLTGTSDWDCWFRQLFAGAGLVGVPFIGAYYRQSPGQLSRDELKMSEMLAKAAAKLLGLAKSHPERLKHWGLDPDATIREYRLRAAKEYSHLAYLYRGRGEKLKAAKCYTLAMGFGDRRALKALMALPFRRPS